MTDKTEQQIVAWLRERAQLQYDAVKDAFGGANMNEMLASTTVARWSELNCAADAIESGAYKKDDER